MRSFPMPVTASTSPTTASDIRDFIGIYVKGHSGDGGNDRADELVQWGKEEGPYARLRALGAGEGDSRFGAAIRENSSLGSEKRVDSRGNGELHRGL